MLSVRRFVYSKLSLYHKVSSSSLKLNEILPKPQEKKGIFSDERMFFKHGYLHLTCFQKRRTNLDNNEIQGITCNSNSILIFYIPLPVARKYMSGEYVLRRLSYMYDLSCLQCEQFFTRLHNTQCMIWFIFVIQSMSLNTVYHNVNAILPHRTFLSLIMPSSTKLTNSMLNIHV